MAPLTDLSGLRDHIPPKQGLRPLAMNSFSPCTFVLRDHIPPKQGLRLRACPCSLRGRLRDHIPPKQGLRLSSLPQLAALNHLRDHIPPKQGLRLYFIVVDMSFFFCLRDHIPPKQGLRLNIPHNNLPIQSVSQRPYPTKTRIKTMLCTERRKLLNWLRDHIPPKQGLRL